MDGPDEPATAVATALDGRGVGVPEDWTTAYREPHVDLRDGAELSLVRHVREALASRGVSADEAVVREAVRDAFDPAVETVAAAPAVVADTAARTSVAVCSNCAVPGLAGAALDRSAVDVDQFDAVVTSVEVGWRKPDERIFEAVAAALDCPVEGLVHVGDNPETDGGIERAGGRAVIRENDTLPPASVLVEGRA